MLIDELKLKAQSGDAKSQYELGLLYSYGDETAGAQLNFKEAIKWFRKSAKQGYAPAYNAIGMAYDNGEAVKRNPKKAFKFIKKAADGGYVVAIRNLANCYDKGDIAKKDKKEAERLYKKAYAKADEIIKQGKGCVNFDSALYVIGTCYSYGEGIELDYEKAKNTTKRQLNLGGCYLRGDGVEQNYDKAMEWYTKAAARNYSRGLCFLAECYENGYGTDKDINEAVKWYIMSANKGFDRAQYFLAECYRYGKGVNTNIKKAVYWYKKSAQQGYQAAYDALSVLKIELNKLSIFRHKRINDYRNKLERKRQKLLSKFGNNEVFEKNARN